MTVATSLEYVYFIRIGRSPFVKIGWTTGDPYRRLGQLNRGAVHQELHLEASIDGGYSVEQAIHAGLARRRKRNEVFRLSRTEVRLIAGSIAALPVGAGADTITALASSAIAERAPLRRPPPKKTRSPNPEVTPEEKLAAVETARQLGFGINEGRLAELRRLVARREGAGRI